MYLHKGHLIPTLPAKSMKIVQEIQGVYGYSTGRLFGLFYCIENAFIWTATSEFGTYRLCEHWRFRRACASAQSPQNLRCSLIQAVSQEEPLDRKPDPWPLWMAGHAQLKFVMTECSKTQIRLTGLICRSGQLTALFMILITFLVIPSIHCTR